MGKARPTLKKKKAAARPATVHQATVTKSKRSQRKVAQEKVARHGRKRELILKLNERTKEADLRRAQGAFVSSDLFGALDEIYVGAEPAAAKGLDRPPPGKTNKGKRLLMAQEASQLGAVLHHRAFVADPMAAIREHLDNTLPRDAHRALGRPTPGNGDGATRRGPKNLMNKKPTTTTTTTTKKKKKKNPAGAGAALKRR